MYIEYLSFYNLIFLFYKIILKKISFKKKIVFYFDKTFFSIVFIKILSIFFKVNFQILDFKLIDVKDNHNELIRLRINRKDLLELKHQIINNNSIFNDIKKDKNLRYYYNYLLKSLSQGHLVMDPHSLTRAVFIIQVVKWHSNKNNISDIVLYMSNRAWFNELKIYAKNNNIKIFKIPQMYTESKKKKNFFFFNIGSNEYPLLYQIYCIIKNIIKFNYPFVKYNYDNSKIYSFPFGHFNLKNNGLNSDLFYFHNSNLEAKNIIVDEISKKNIQELIFNKFNIIDHKTIFSKKFILPKKNFFFKKNELKYLEYNFFKKKLKNYNLHQRKTHFFLNANNIKIYLTWNKYLLNHIPEHETIRNMGGIFAIWQYAFEGTPDCNAQMSTDVFFSNFSKNYFFNNNSNIKYFINTGFLMDYQFELLKEKAQILRNQLLKNGAKYIVSVFDENSNKFDRWHTGHLLQAENYEIILKELLNNPDLGVIFKPKKAKDLRERIGSVNQILVQAENTGRCFVYDNYTSVRTSEPPILAGLSSDICIHSHLCAGTAAVECALANLPTILIDREGCPESILYNFLDKNTIFKSWEDVIYAINDNLNSKNKNLNFGKWPDHLLNSLDNFRDGKAAFRMGEYLNTMINLINNNESRDKVMATAAEIYAEKYGIDKVTTIN